MDEQKQIEKMAKYLTHCFMNCAPCEKCRAYIYSEQLYNAGYSKQSKGEWVKTVYKTVEHGFVERRGTVWMCTNCRHASKRFDRYMKFCPNCGAKMKGV